MTNNVMWSPFNNIPSQVGILHVLHLVDKEVVKWEVSVDAYTLESSPPRPADIITSSILPEA